LRDDFRFSFLELVKGGQVSVGAAKVTSFEVQHASGAPAFALRVEYGGKIVSYSGDTQWTDALIEVAKRADLFIAEAYFFEKQIKYHLDFLTLRSHRSELDCRKMVLTHPSEDMLQRRAEVDAECADDLTIISL